VPDPQPILERRRTLADAFAVRANTVIPAIAIGLLTTSYVLWLARRRGRDRRYAGSAVDAAFGNATGAEEPVGIRREDAGPVEFVPPDGVLPGQVGTLVDEHANLVDVIGALREDVEGGLAGQVVDPVDRGRRLLAANEDGYPGIRKIEQDPLEDHLPEEAGDAREEDALARERLDDGAAFLYHAADYALSTGW